MAIGGGIASVKADGRSPLDQQGTRGPGRVDSNDKDVGVRAWNWHLNNLRLPGRFEAVVARVDDFGRRRSRDTDDSAFAGLVGYANDDEAAIAVCHGSHRLDETAAELLLVLDR
jgi:hypothetical protein